jgi:hypothetical protein
MNARRLFYAIPISTLFVLVALLSVADAATTISTNIQTDGTLSVTGTSTLTGNVGVNTSSPSYNLDVTGLGHFTGLVDAANFVATSSGATSNFLGKMTVGLTGNPFGFSPIDLEMNGGGGIGIVSYRNSILGGNLEMLHARGTQSSPQNLNLNDQGGNLYLDGYVGGADEILGDINAMYTGTVGGKVYGALEFATDQTPDAVMYLGASNPNNYVAINYPFSLIATSTNAGALQVNGNVGFGTTTPVANFQVANGNATTTMEIGSSGQNKGSCLKLYRTDGSAIYAYVAAGATTFTLSTTACASVSNF